MGYAIHAGLDEERATLLVLLGRFDNAADVYINVLRDPEAAVKSVSIPQCKSLFCVSL